jgi:hypothetical protein
MNKHTAINEKTGQVFTRNSATKIYSHAIMADIYFTDGRVEADYPSATWTSRLDLAQGIKARLERDYIAKEWDLTVERVEVRILKAEVK